MYASLESGTNGSLIRFSFDTNQWMRVGPGKNLSMGGLHHFAEYNPVHKLVLFGSGDGSNDIYTVNSTGQITKKGDSPVVLGPNHTITTVDPVSGDYLVFTMGRQFYVYDVIADSWDLQSASVPIWTSRYSGKDVHGVVATPVSTYGINLFVTCNGGDCRVTLYKHSAGTRKEAKAKAKEKGNIRVSPNPFRNQVSIAFDENIGLSDIVRIYDIQGRLVADLSPSLRRQAAFLWHAGNLPGGIYLLKAVLGGKQVSKRFFIQR
jgi:hypothetical protein